MTDAVACIETGTVAIPASLALTRTGTGFTQPIQDADLQEYLDTRRAQPIHIGEEALWVKLPADVRGEVEALERAFVFVQSLVKARHRVEPACRKTLSLYARQANYHGWELKTFRAKYDRWVKAKDWVVLINRSKAGAIWQSSNRGLPEAFINYVVERFGKFGRADGKRQAWESIKRQWRTGLNERGNLESIPGYDAQWEQRNREICPDGWHYSNILRQVKARSTKWNAATRALLHEGTAAAKEFLPWVLSTRRGLRFLERVTFDDVRTDWLIFDPSTGQPCELWLLVARDLATAMILGFVMHPSRVRPDGSESHLGLEEMKQLAGFLLERYPLPKDYICHWTVERGTATLSVGSARAIQEMLPNRIQVHYTSMIGGTSPAGYRESKKGNSTGKASHESHNRLIHTQGAYIFGQTGSRYEIRPASLKARCEECIEIWEMRNQLPPHLQGREKYTLLTTEQAREHLYRICVDQNFRDEHALEDFERVLEWYDPASGKWQPQNTAPHPLPAGARLRKRMERPVERAIRLAAGHEWEWVSQDIIIAFLSHTVRPVTVANVKGEIVFRHDNRQLVFAPPDGIAVPRIDSKLLGYIHPDDPRFLHVTDGRSSILGTWYRRDRVPMRDQEALQESIRYTRSAMKAAREQAEQIAEPERRELAEIRAHNAELQSCNQFIPVADPVQEQPVREEIASRVAAGLVAGVQAARMETKEMHDQEAEDARIAREALSHLNG